jgi:hypothetical protein
MRLWKFGLDSPSFTKKYVNKQMACGFRRYGYHDIHGGSGRKWHWAQGLNI